MGRGKNLLWCYLQWKTMQLKKIEPYLYMLMWKNLQYLFLVKNKHERKINSIKACVCVCVCVCVRERERERQRERERWRERMLAH